MDLSSTFLYVARDIGTDDGPIRSPREREGKQDCPRRSLFDPTSLATLANHISCHFGVSVLPAPDLHFVESLGDGASEDKEMRWAVYNVGQSPPEELSFCSSDKLT
jgi:hypothetical protein